MTMGMTGRGERLANIFQIANLYTAKVVEELTSKGGNFTGIRIDLMVDRGVVRLTGFNVLCKLHDKDERAFVLSEVEEQGEDVLLRNIASMASVLDAKVVGDVLEALKNKSYEEISERWTKRALEAAQAPVPMPDRAPPPVEPGPETGTAPVEPGPETGTAPVEPGPETPSDPDEPCEDEDEESRFE